MPKLLFRIICLVVIPCLLAEPNIASVFFINAFQRPLFPHGQMLFAGQVLESPLVESQFGGKNGNFEPHIRSRAILEVPKHKQEYRQMRSAASLAGIIFADEEDMTAEGKRYRPNELHRKFYHPPLEQLASALTEILDVPPLRLPDFMDIARIQEFFGRHPELLSDWKKRVESIWPARVWLEPYHLEKAVIEGLAEHTHFRDNWPDDILQAVLSRPNDMLTHAVRRYVRDWVLEIEHRIYMPDEFARLMLEKFPYRTENRPATLQEREQWKRVAVNTLNKSFWVSQAGYPPNDIVTNLFLEFLQLQSTWFSTIRLLELGAGAMPVSILAARLGASVVAGEIDDETARYGEANLAEESKEVQARIRIVTSDLNRSVRLIALPFRQAFDAVIFVHPIVDAEPNYAFEQAGMAGIGFRVLRRTLEGLPEPLALTGGGLFWLSEKSSYSMFSRWNRDNVEQFLPKGWQFYSVHSDAEGQRHLIWVERLWESLNPHEKDFVRQHSGRLPPWSRLLDAVA